MSVLVRAWFQRFLRNKRLVAACEAIAWFSLSGFLVYSLFFQPRFMLILGSLIATVIGIYLLWAFFSSRATSGVAEPFLTRGLSLSMGLVATIVGVGMALWIFSGGVPTRQQVLEQRLDSARHGTTWLDLSGLRLREIPAEVWDYQHLIELNLGGNRLWSLPPEIARLENLERLYLDDNRIEALPPDIGMLSRLKWLDLDANRLHELPPEIARLQELTHLKLQYNRFKTFPAVILELPNLELLFLAGNRMGELPTVITQRALAGKLSLWYKPTASRVDWASISVILFCFVLPTGASWFVNRWWTAREQLQQQAAHHEGQVFPIPPLLREPALFVLLTLAAVSLFVAIASLSGGLTQEAGWGIPLLFSPLMLGALALLLHNTGLVLLKKDGIALRRGRRERLLPYDAIIAVRSSFDLRIEGESRTLRIPRTVLGFPELYEALLSRIPQEARRASLAHSARNSARAPDFAENVIQFGVPRRIWGLYMVGTILFTALYLGIGLMGLWISLARGDVPPFTWRWLRDTLILFLLVSALFLPALLWILRSFFTAYGPFGIKQPVALELYPQSLRYRFPFRPWQMYSVTDLQRVWVESVPVEVRSRAAGAILSQQVMRLMLRLEFSDGTRLVVDQERAVQLGTSVEQLRAILKQVYGK